jgi:hypothetical protein
MPLEDDKEEVLAKLPSQHHGWKDVFFKEVSDMLPPHGFCNHKMELRRARRGYIPYDAVRRTSCPQRS